MTTGEYAVVGMGFVEIVNNRVTLLVETAEHPEEIDIARAREARREPRSSFDRSRVSRSTITQELSLAVP